MINRRAWLSAIVSVAASGVLGGCPNPAIDATEWACNIDAECADDWVCACGVCVSPEQAGNGCGGDVISPTDTNGEDAVAAGDTTDADTGPTTDADTGGTTDADTGGVATDTGSPPADTGGTLNDTDSSVGSDSMSTDTLAVDPCLTLDCSAIDTVCALGQCVDGACVLVGRGSQGVACDDGNVCTDNDMCTPSGACEGEAATCDDGLDCSVDSCDPDSGCVFDTSPCPCLDNLTCDDGNACNGAELCVMNACVAGVPVDCPAPADVCKAAQCDAATGDCLEVVGPAADCDDGSACTVSDTCVNGTCQGATISCNDGLACSADSCDPASGCVHDTSTCECVDDNDCPDDNLCDGVMTCVDNACVNGPAVLCPQSDNPCEESWCAPATGACGFAPVAGTPACNDGDACTSGDQCVGGVCSGAPTLCNDNIGCTVDTCGANGVCVYDDSGCGCLNNSDCLDTNVCNGVETCDQTTNTCVPGTPVTCSQPSNDCQESACDPTVGCNNQPVPNGTTCDDGDACTTGDGCFNGACAGFIIDCDDGIACTNDQCTNTGNCVSTATAACECQSAADCDDGNSCNGNETCEDFVCVDGTPSGDPQCLVRTIDAGWSHTCAVLSKQVKCWGEGSHGSLGYGNTNNIGDNETPASVGYVDLGFVPNQVSAGASISCALSTTGQVKCWGSGSSGRPGYANTETLGDNEVPASYGFVSLGGTATTRLSSSGIYTCAQQGAQGRCWGLNFFGELGIPGVNAIGDNEPPDLYNPLTIPSGMFHLSAGFQHACAVSQDGPVYCWGDGGDGALGYANTNDIDDIGNTSPIQLGSGLPDRVVGGADHTCVLLNGGKVRCWGSGARGKLGYGNTTSIGDNEHPSVAGDVPLGGNATSICAGESHTCVIMTGGAVRCWGHGTSGQLGYGNTNDIGDNETPASVGDVPLGASASHITCGYSHTCVQTTLGQFRCWGNNAQGRLGYGHTDTIGDDETPASAGDIPIQ